MQKQEIETQYIIEDSTVGADGQRMDTMTINMGPQHPSTHGVLRLILTIEGETVLKAVPDIGFLQTLRDAVSLARRLGVGVCMECNACWLERGLADTVSECVDVLYLVQVSDFVVGTKDTPNRAVPGDGDIPLERILGQIIDAGYNGSLDLEIIGPRIEEEGYPAAIRRSVEAVGSMLSSVRA